MYLVFCLYDVQFSQRISSTTSMTKTTQANYIYVQKAFRAFDEVGDMSGTTQCSCHRRRMIGSQIVSVYLTENPGILAFLGETESQTIFPSLRIFSSSYQHDYNRIFFGMDHVCVISSPHNNLTTAKKKTEISKPRVKIDDVCLQYLCSSSTLVLTTPRFSLPHNMQISIFD